MGSRPTGWGRLLERLVEAPYLRRADLVLAVSDQVADRLTELGVDRERLLVTPCAVDIARFDAAVTRRRGAAGQPLRVVWIGSFRKFHGLGVLIDVLAQFRPGEIDVTFVGDGLQRRDIEEKVRSVGLDATFTGSVSSEQIPGILAEHDVGVVTSSGDGEFHYSPLKLREYLAAGLAVVAPDEPDVRSTVADDTEALLYSAGSGSELHRRLRQLVDDPGMIVELSEKARQLAVAELTWERQLERVLAALGQETA